jgi:oligopeptide transport system permease protein
VDHPRDPARDSDDVLHDAVYALPDQRLGRMGVVGAAGDHARLAPMAMLAQLVRGSMLETLRQDCVRTAKANGLHWRRVVGLHVLRNSLIPAVTAIGPLLGYLIAGSFIVETIFGIPGIGRYFIISVGSRDYTVVMGITGLLSMIIIIANLIVDILYGYLDPRTRDVRT